MPEKISVLLLARKRSRFLSHFLFNYFSTTANVTNTELLVMATEGDEWNKDLFKFFEQFPVRFFFENRKLGKNGRHILFNELLKIASGDWILTVSDDHIFTIPDWDESIRTFVESQGIDHDQVFVLLPRHNNAGEISHILSRRWVDTVGRIAECGAVDSWINEVCIGLPPARIRRTFDVLMSDLGQNYEWVDDCGQQDTSRGDILPRFGMEEVSQQIDIDRQKLITAIKES